MHPGLKVAVLVGVGIGAAWSAMKSYEDQERERVRPYQNVRTAPEFRGDNTDDDDKEEEEEEEEETEEEEEEEVNFFADIKEDIEYGDNEDCEYGPDKEDIRCSAGGENRPSNGETIGIDLGTASSCVGVWQNGRVKIIGNEHNNRTTPSYVSFTETGADAGDNAKLQAIMNAPNTVFNAKRLIGRKFTDHGVQADMERWPFSVVSGTDDVPEVEVDCQGNRRKFTAEDISCMVIMKMKKIAEEYLETKVTNAVITVPAHFNHIQRQATIDAGSRAGLDVLRIINETTAAAIAYYDASRREQQEEEEKTILVFDLGAGSLDVSILTVEDGTFEVEATAANSRLGGDDFDNCMVSYVLKIMKRHFGRDFSGHQQVLLHVQAECERVKRILSSSTSTTIEICPLCDGINFKINITRNQFEELCMGDFMKCVYPVEKVLQDVSNRISKADIDEVVLVGGSTRIPIIQKMLTELFNGKELCRSVVSDSEAVTYGATIQAAILSGKSNLPEELSEMQCFDIIPFSLGLETDGGEMTAMVKKKTPFPFKETITFTTHADNQSRVLIKVFEGESLLTCNNIFIGELSLDGIPPMLSGKPKIKVSFDIDRCGILTVSAIEESTGTKNKLNIKGKPRRVDTAYTSGETTLTKYNPV